MKKILLGIVLLAALVACGDAHKGEHCVRSHEESVILPICAAYSSAGCTVWTYVPETDTVCDEWAPDNPATVKAKP